MSVICHKAFLKSEPDLFKAIRIILVTWATGVWIGPNISSKV